MYSKEYFSRVTTIYFIILIVILIYEHTRKTVQKALKVHQTLLDNTIYKLDKQQTEYIKIMKNTNDGIFLLDQKLKIKSPYSIAFKNIISANFITIGASFTSLLEGKIFKSKLIQLENYLQKIIETKHIPLELFNPVEKITLHSKQSSGTQIKTLSFSFTTIPLKNGNHEILGKVADITKEVHLEKKLHEQKTKKIQEVERIMTLTHIDPEDLKEFIKSTSQKLTELKERTRETHYHLNLHRYAKAFDEAGQDSQLELITDSLSEFHAIKGNASVIGFISFAELIHGYETELKTLKEAVLQKRKLSETKQNQLMKFIKTLLQEIVTTENIIYKLGEFNYRYMQLSKKFTNKFSNFLYRSIQISKDKHHPPIELVSKKFDESLFVHHKSLYKLLKDILVLLIKNSLCHGIEADAERKKIGKSKTATIEISTDLLKNRMLQLTYCDDGRGLNLARIQEQLLKQNVYTAEALKKLSHHTLYQCIFNKDFSTESKVSLDSGRGIGLYFVKKNIEALGGKIEISSTPGQGVKFTFHLPLPEKAEIKTAPLPAHIES